MAENAPRLMYAKNGIRLYHGDCITWMDAQQAQTIHGVVCDPPFGGIEYEPTEISKKEAGRGGVWRIPPSYDGHLRSALPRFTVLTPEDVHTLNAFFISWGTSLLRVMVPGAHLLLASNPLLSYRVATALTECGFERRGEIVRLVQTLRGGDRPKGAHKEFPQVSVMPRSQWEPWLLFRKPCEGTVAQNLRKYQTGGLMRISEDLPFGDVIRSAPTGKRERQISNHPSLKPQAFMRQVVRAILPLGSGVILDPFAGSGSTLAAAQYLGLEAVGVERKREYIEDARRAIPQLAELELNVTPAKKSL